MFIQLSVHLWYNESTTNWEDIYDQILPDEYYSSTYKIDFKKYYDMGYRGILFDIDNTLVRHNEPATSRAIQLMEQLKAMGFKVCLVSNNKEPRVAAFNKKMKVNYIFKAGKPSKRATSVP